MKFKIFISAAFAVIIMFSFFSCKQVPEQKPNIVWIMMEDWGYQLSCYGEPGIYTPNIDKFASEGIRYTNSFCTAPVCSRRVLQ